MCTKMNEVGEVEKVKGAKYIVFVQQLPFNAGRGEGLTVTFSPQPGERI